MKFKIPGISALCVVFCAFLLNSCVQDNLTNETVSEVKFSFGSNSALAKTMAHNFSAIMITIVNGNGQVVFDKKVLTLYSMGGGYLSETLSLKTGEYTLTEFLVLNSENKVTHATPIEGSALAHLVIDPLPISFSVETDETTYVNPEVIAVTDENAKDFGYAIFGLSVVDVLKFKIAVYTYNAASDTVSITSSDLTITSENAPVLVKSLSASIHTLSVRDSLERYTVSVSKSGYGTYSRTFTRTELSHYKNKALVVTLYTQSLYQGLKLYYPFPGNELDYSGNNYHAVNHGATLTEDKDGNINSAYSFDGFTDFMDCGNILDDLTYPFTVSVWVKPADHTGRLYNTIFTAQDNSPLYNGFEIHISHGTSVGVAIGDGLGENSGAYSRYKSATINDRTGMWTHVAAVVVSNTDMRLYVNGVDVGGYYAGYTSNPINSNFPQDVARMARWRSNGNTYYYTGLIDEFKVWNRALTQQEIKASR